MPKVTVVIPTYNRSHLLKAAILSVLNQTYQDFEIIVVDDASTDDTSEVVAGLDEQRIKYTHHEVNQGEAGTRNSGILSARSKYIAFLDDDDEWLPQKLEMQVEKTVTSTKRTGLIYTGLIICRYVENKLIKEFQNIPVHKGNIYHLLKNRNFIVTPSSVFIKTECVEKVGLFDTEIAYGLVYDYWIRISKHFDIDYLAETLVKYRVHENRLSSDNELRAQGGRDLAKKYGNQILSEYWRDIYFPLGVERCHKGEMIKGINALLRSIWHRPKHIKGYIYLWVALFGHGNFKRAIMCKTMLLAKLRRKKNNTTNILK